MEETVTGPLYHDVSPVKMLMGKIFAGIVLINVVLAFIFCFVKGTKDGTLYLLAINLAISTVVAFFLAYWYQSGVLPADRYNFIIFVGVCVAFQAIVSDIYVWHGKPIPDNGYVSPTISPTAANITTPKPPPPGWRN